MKSHSVDVLALVFGLIFVGLATGWLVRQYATVTAAGVGWALAAGLLGLGGIGILYALSLLRRPRAARGRSDPPADADRR